MDPRACINRMSLKDRADQDAETHGFKIEATSFNDDAIVEPHPSQLRALPSQALFEQCPIVLTGDPRVPAQALAGSFDPSLPVPVNQQIALDSELFSGCIYALVRDLPGAPQAVFAGTKWLTSTVIQGRFKRPTPAADLWVGQELWNKPHLPVSLQRLVYSTAAKSFSSTSRIATEGDGVGFTNPLLAMAQIVNVSKPGCQPDALQAQEDARLLGRNMVDSKGNPLAAAKRQKFFDKPSNLAAATFDDVNIYTFVIGQSLLDLPMYKLSLGGFLTLDLCSILNGQPLQMMCKNVRDNSTIVSLLVWHERLNYQQGMPARHGSRACSSSYSASGGSRGGGHSRCSSTDCSSSSSSSSCDAGSSSISRCSSSDSCNTDNCRSSSTSSELEQHPDNASCCSSVYGSACSDFSSECGSLAGDFDICLAEVGTAAAAESHAGSKSTDAVSNRRDTAQHGSANLYLLNGCSGLSDVPVGVEAGLQKLPGSATSKLVARWKSVSSKICLKKLVVGKSKKDGSS